MEKSRKTKNTTGNDLSIECGTAKKKRTETITTATN